MLQPAVEVSNGHPFDTASARAPILIIGYARPGMSWLGRIFDSHSDVMYLHEPDKLLPGKELPYFCDAAEFDLSAVQAAEYFDRLMAVRSLNSVGILPIFRKKYHSNTEHLRHLLSIVTRKGVQLAFPDFTPLAKQAIPDPADFHEYDSRRVVVKSVSQLGCAGLFASTIPKLKTILIIRHPCVHILSMLRGMRADKFQRGLLEPSIVDTANARRCGLTLERFRSLSMTEQLAWQWLIFNEKAMENLRDRPNARVVRYRDLVQALENTAKELFAFTDLSWPQQTRRFLYESQHSGRRYRYFGVYRSPELMQTIDSWKGALRADEA